MAPAIFVAQLIVIERHCSPERRLRLARARARWIVENIPPHMQAAVWQDALALAACALEGTCLESY